LKAVAYRFDIDDKIRSSDAPRLLIVFMTAMNAWIALVEFRFDSSIDFTESISAIEAAVSGNLKEIRF
jgi:hypothetical protein